MGSTCDSSTGHLLSQINRMLAECSEYRLECFSTKKQHKKLKLMLETNKAHGCHFHSDMFQLGDNGEQLFIIAALKGESVGSYISYTLENHYSGDPTRRYIHINFTCTSIDHRNQRLSIILRMLPMLKAKILGVTYVSSDTHEMSKTLLKKYFGFTVTPDFQENFNYEANSWVDITTPEFHKILSARWTEVCRT